MGECRRGVQQVGIERQLIVRVRRIGARQLELCQLERIVQPVLTSGQHIAKAASIVRPIRLHRSVASSSRPSGWYGGGQRDRGHNCEYPQPLAHLHHPSLPSCSAAPRS